MAQRVRQLDALAQTRLLGQAVGVPASQAPAPSQLLGVSWLPLQLGVAQAVPFAGKVQAPVLSQAVAPQVASLAEHRAAQQLPLPLMPQISETHCPFAVQAAPLLSTAEQLPPLQ